MEKGFDRIEKLIENLAVSTKDGFDAVGKRFTGLEKELVSTKLRMEENFLLVHQELASIRQDIELLNKEVNRLKHKVDLIINTEKEDTVVLFKDIEKLKIKVSELEAQLKEVGPIN